MPSLQLFAAGPFSLAVKVRCENDTWNDFLVVRFRPRGVTIGMKCYKLDCNIPDRSVCPASHKCAVNNGERVYGQEGCVNVLLSESEQSSRSAETKKSSNQSNWF